MKLSNLSIFFLALMFAGGEPVVQMTVMQEVLLKIFVFTILTAFAFKDELKLRLQNK